MFIGKRRLNLSLADVKPDTSVDGTKKDREEGRNSCTGKTARIET